MFTRRLLAPVVVATIALIAACSGSTDDGTDEGAGAETAGTARPPQFVLLAFDGSLNLDFWEESRAFAKQAGVKFTYFMSGVYFLPNAKKALYHGPHHSVGQSDIGFGGPASDIPKRLQEVVSARAEGHEMASHVNGHYDGTKWSESDWDSEFSQFGPLIFDAAKNAGVTGPNLGFTISDVKGFRAPLLGQGPPLYQTLAKNKFAYDTSKTNATNYWPEKQNGVWNFPLAQVKIASGPDQGRHTLSMDYNFYFTQSGGKDNLAKKDTYQKEMLDTYMTYFQGNYFGNRAPVSIGHHFSKWNGGAYWNAMQAFATKVCGLPEVKCVTYSELVSFMEQNVSNRATFQSGKFTQMPRPPGVDTAPAVDAPIADDQLAAAGIVGEPADACDEAASQPECVTDTDCDPDGSLAAAGTPMMCSPTSTCVAADATATPATPATP